SNDETIREAARHGSAFLESRRNGRIHLRRLPRNSCGERIRSGAGDCKPPHRRSRGPARYSLLGMPVRSTVLAALLLPALVSVSAALPREAAKPRSVPGRAAGETLLPNGWRI